jgi:multidrug efflux pump subunit AcrB
MTSKTAGVGGRSSANREPRPYWIAQHSRPVVFLILTLAMLGAYLAFTIPVSVFPTTDFPRVLISVDNGVMPIDQMMVTITRSIEDAVNSVPGLLNVRSITSRGSAEIDLYFVWGVDMFQTLQYVNAAISRVQPELPATAKIEAHRMNFASFPIIGYSVTSNTMPPTKLWEMVTYEMKPRLNRLEGVSTVIVQGGQEPEFQVTPDPAKLLSASVTVSDILDAVRKTNLVDAPAESSTVSRFDQWAGTNARRNCERRHQKYASRNPGTNRRYCNRSPEREAGVHSSNRERAARGSVEHQPST